MSSLLNFFSVPASTLIGSGNLSAHDWLALLCVVLGVISLLSMGHRRPELGISIFVATTSAGAWLVFYDRFSSTLSLHPFAIVFTSSVCLICAALGYLASLGRKVKRDHTAPSTVFFVWALLTGVSAGLLISFHLFVLFIPRVLDPTRPAAETASLEGFIFIAFLLAAMLLWRARERRDEQPVFFLILGALLVWWTAMALPSANTPQSMGRWFSVLPAWWSWLFHLEAGLSLLLLAAAFLQDMGYRRRRERAWPDRLDDLLEPYSRWPGYIQTEAIIAAVVLLLGVYEIVAGGAPSIWRCLASFLAALIAGYSCLFMTYRRWSGNTAGLGMALVSLSAMSVASAIAFLLISSGIAGQYPRRMPVQFNAMLFAMGMMAALWRWLAEVWQQQLLDGMAWTTTGRMVPFSKRSAFFLLALALLIGFQMAFWPQYKYGSEDDTIGRLLSGVLALGILALVAMVISHKDQSSAEASLGLGFIAAAIAFIMIRLPTSDARGWLAQYQALVLSGLALPVFAMSEIMDKRTKWRSLALPLGVLALLLMPAAALTNLLKSAPPSEWLRPLTLAVLGALYCLAGSRERRRAFLVLGAVLVIAAVSSVLRSYG